MTLSLVAVGAKITAAIMNSIIGAVNTSGTNLVKPSTVAGTGVAVTSLGSVTLTGATAANINGCFTGTYTNYRIIIDIPTMAAAAAPMMVLRSSGTDDTAAHYDSQEGKAINTTASASQSLAGTSWPITASSALTNHEVIIDLFRPAASSPTTGIVFAIATSNPMTSTAAVHQLGISHRSATAYDGFSITSAQAMTGTISVYGYNAG